MAVIYHLFDEVRQTVFYVGRTVEEVARLENHIRQGVMSSRDWRLKDLWIQHLINIDEVPPALKIIETCSNEIQEVREMYWLHEALLAGYPVVNVSFKGIEANGMSVDDAKSLAKANRVTWARLNRNFPL